MNAQAQRARARRHAAELGHELLRFTHLADRRRWRGVCVRCAGAADVIVNTETGEAVGLAVEHPCSEAWRYECDNR